MNELSSFLSRALDCLFLRNPTRTSTGILLGVMLSGFTPVFTPMLFSLTNLDFSVVPLVAWIAFGVLISSVRGSPIREKLPEQIELLFDLLKKAEKAGVDKEELQSRYKQITSNYIQNVGLSLKNQEELDAIKEALRHHNI
jgi:hypothetical protein